MFDIKGKAAPLRLNTGDLGVWGRITYLVMIWVESYSTLSRTRRQNATTRSWQSDHRILRRAGRGMRLESCSHCDHKAALARKRKQKSLYWLHDFSPCSCGIRRGSTCPRKVDAGLGASSWTCFGTAPPCWSVSAPGTDGNPFWKIVTRNSRSSNA